jgi:hypothetical protein
MARWIDEMREIQELEDRINTIKERHEMLKNLKDKNDNS